MPFCTVSSLETIFIDYVIVGGGTAGLVTAARLSENPNVAVLVIEAGYIGRNIARDGFDWTFLSVPQRHANDRVILQPRGKGLGGSSILNFLGLFRPSKQEMNALEALGNPGWNWESMLHYMQKSETLLPPTLTHSEAVKYAAKPKKDLHGSEGPLKKSFPTMLTRLHAEFFDAAEYIGIPRNPESSSGINVGAMTFLMSVDSDSKRSSSVSGYLEPNLSRPNLFVLTEAHVTKIILNSVDGLHRATGVEFVKHGVTSVVRNIQKDVILAAGSFQTPQILELSGIGNPDVLGRYSIETLIDLPGVGENLQDHVGVSTIVEVETTDLTVDSLSDPVVEKEHLELYKQKKGLLSSSRTSAFIYLTAEDIGLPTVASNNKVAQAPTPALKQGLEKQYRIQEQLLSSKNQAHGEVLYFNGHQSVLYSAPEAGKKYMSLFCVLLHPLSRGTVHIMSSDPLAPPAIDPNYFADDIDLDSLVQIVEVALKLYDTPPLSQSVKAHKVPSQEVIDQGKNGLREDAKENCRTIFHPVGTAAMLPLEDGGVVDANLLVYGTTNLRVELSCHIQSIAYAIGEKAADIILGKQVLEM
ncbi:GMC oxidoreductase [Gymnopus androsaceus JB14]|uniref:GMC oxidoreductase n=1 Tax=Gymnopus androsaceus JB14 TaxID=1447944 RepID=A0A6A4I659_9AGAR|nr:GMC oxidoreductase [Gymnopus androsaceus JB14]